MENKDQLSCSHITLVTMLNVDPTFFYIYLLFDSCCFQLNLIVYDTSTEETCIFVWDYFNYFYSNIPIPSWRVSEQMIASYVSFFVFN